MNDLSIYKCWFCDKLLTEFVEAHPFWCNEICCKKDTRHNYTIEDMLKRNELEERELLVAKEKKSKEKKEEEMYICKHRRNTMDHKSFCMKIHGYPSIKEASNKPEK